MEPMQLEVAVETELFLLACLLGAGMGVIYDLVSAMRNTFHHGKVAMFAEDFLYTLLFGFGYFVFCTGLTMGIRGFVLIGMIAGCVVERLTVGRLLILSVSKVFEVVKRFILAPVTGLFAKILKLIDKRIVKKYLNFYKSKKIVEKPLKV